MAEVAAILFTVSSKVSAERRVRIPAFAVSVVHVFVAVDSIFTFFLAILRAFLLIVVLLLVLLRVSVLRLDVARHRGKHTLALFLFLLLLWVHVWVDILFGDHAD